MRPPNLLILNSARKWIGEAAHTLALAQGLARRGHRVVLGARRGFELEARARESGALESGRPRESGLRLLSLTFSSRFNVVSDLRDWRAIRRTVREESIDLVHCHRGKDHWLAALAVAAGKMPAPVVRTRHVVTPARGHAFNRWLYGRATAGVIGVSQAARGSLGGLLDAFPPERRPVIYSAVDSSLFSPAHRSDEARRELGAAPGDVLVGLIGRIQNVKGQRDFVRAAARVASRVPNARFLVAGRGPRGRVERLRRFAVEHGLPPDRLAVRGWLADLPRVMASLDVGVVASVGSEGSSRAALEYLASGVPIVATRVGGIPELLEDGTDSLLVAPRDPETLAERIVRLALDKDERSRLGRAGRRRALERFAPDRWLDEILSLYAAVREKAP